MFASLLSHIIPQAYAQCDNTGEGGLELGDCLTLGVGEGTRVSDLYQTPTDLINPLINFLFVASGLLFFLLIIYSGIKFISGASKGKDEAKTIMTAAVSGLVVMFAAYWVVRIAEVLTGMELIF